ncbi:CGNR zinc finger domain-containing protein [Streptomyces sp. G35A]
MRPVRPGVAVDVAVDPCGGHPSAGSTRPAAGRSRHSRSAMSTMRARTGSGTASRGCQAASSVDPPISLGAPPGRAKPRLGEQLAAGDPALVDQPYAVVVHGAPEAGGEGAPGWGAEAVDAVLAHGRIRATLTADGPGERPEFDDASWGPAWLAARDYLRLLTLAPDRIRGCAHEACVLHFFDTSRIGTRRWCSMAACGNRAKASRHYARTKDA